MNHSRLTYYVTMLWLQNVSIKSVLNLTLISQHTYVIVSGLGFEKKKQRQDTLRQIDAQSYIAQNVHTHYMYKTQLWSSCHTLQDWYAFIMEIRIELHDCTLLYAPAPRLRLIAQCEWHRTSVARVDWMPLIGLSRRRYDRLRRQTSIDVRRAVVPKSK